MKKEQIIIRIVVGVSWLPIIRSNKLRTAAEVGSPISQQADTVFSRCFKLNDQDEKVQVQVQNNDL